MVCLDFGILQFIQNHNKALANMADAGGIWVKVPKGKLRGSSEV